MTFLIYLYLVVFIIFDIVILVIGIEQIVCGVLNIAPKVPSSRQLRNAVSLAIAENMPNAKTVLDIGSGWGGMLRAQSRRFPDMKFYGLEIMPIPFLYSSFTTTFNKNIKIHFGNAFKYLDKTDAKFDVGIAYLLTPEMKNAQYFLSRFKMLLVIDFPLPDAAPYQKIKLHKDILGQHFLYVYKS